jgi:hypothetical protein
MRSESAFWRRGRGEHVEAANSFLGREIIGERAPKKVRNTQERFRAWP